MPHKFSKWVTDISPVCQRTGRFACTVVPIDPVRVLTCRSPICAACASQILRRIDVRHSLASAFSESYESCLTHLRQQRLRSTGATI